MKIEVVKYDHIFQGEVPFKSCHASTIEKFTEEIIGVAWFGGEHEKAADVAIWFSRCIDGTWEFPIKVADRDGIPCWNPVLYARDGEVILYYKIGENPGVWQTFYKISKDHGVTWSEEYELVCGDIGGRGPVKNKPISLKNGTLLAPASLEDGQWRCFVDRQEAANGIWEKSQDIKVLDAKGEGVIQPSLWESKDGHVHMLMRSSEGVLYRSDSMDQGRTWTVPVKTDLPNNNSGMDVALLEEGKVVLVCNPISKNWGARNTISLMISEDNGDSWSEQVILESLLCHKNEEWAEFSYPAIIAWENHIYITYTWKRETIAFWHLIIE